MDSLSSFVSCPLRLVTVTLHGQLLFLRAEEARHTSAKVLRVIDLTDVVVHQVFQIFGHSTHFFLSLGRHLAPDLQFFVRTHVFFGGR